MENHMQFSVGVEYAFHTLFYMVEIPAGKTVGIKQLANLNKITETYLSKIFAKLKKAGVVRSVPGVKGGYELARPADQISFWDVIEAIEGSSFFFQCADLRKKDLFVEDPSIFSDKCPCLIKVVIQEAEELFRNKLKTRSLQWLYNQAGKNFDTDRKKAINDWVKSL
jgi:Rrf2 family protein